MTYVCVLAHCWAGSTAGLWLQCGVAVDGTADAECVGLDGLPRRPASRHTRQQPR